MRVLLIKGHSQYGGTRLFASQAAQAFEAAGHATDVLDLTVGNPTERLNDHASACETDLVFSICILGEYRNAKGQSVAEMYGAPHVVWHTDYALSQTARLDLTPQSTPVLFVDPTQIDAVRATLGPDRLTNMSFFPHPAVGPPAPDDASLEDFEANRPIQLLWSGSFQKPDTTWNNVPDQLKRPLHDAVDLALSVEWMPPHQALVHVLESRGLDMSDPESRGAISLATYVDTTVRQTRRFEFVKSIAKTGIPIHICGTDWERHLYRFKNATYEGPVEMTRMVELMGRSRIVLNTNGNFGAGSHERPFSASLAGAATFSDRSRYYETAFGPGEIELYRWKDLAEAMKKLEALAADPGRCFEMARAAKARTLAGHTWKQGIERILEAAGLAPAPTRA